MAMAANTASSSAGLGGRSGGVRVVVIGDAGTGKSSLIVSVATDSLPENVPHVMPPTRLPADYYPDRIPITIIDTSSRMENRAKLVAECQAADAVVLTYACDRPATLDRLSTYWLPELRQMEVRVPVIVVGCKLDLRHEQQVSLEQVMSPIMQQYREIETCIECSALRQIQVGEVFYYAQKAVLHPTAPLFDQETQSLKPRCVRALKRIFILCDHDRDGALSDAELNDFQVRCFNAPLQPNEIAGVKKVVQEKMPEGVNEHGLTLTGFLFLHALFIEKGRLETTWTVLRKFGYSNNLKLRDDLIPSIFKRTPDQSMELTNEAIEFLKAIFFTFDIDNDGALRPAELEDLFSTAPENPWSEAPYKDAAEKNVLGGLSLEGFLSEWALMTLQDPAASLANLIYIGYGNDPSSAFQIMRKRRLDRKRQQTQRNVFQCFVFGPQNAGKSALLNSLIGRMKQPNDLMEVLETLHISERQVCVSWFKVGRWFYGFRLPDEQRSCTLSLGYLTMAKEEEVLFVLNQGMVHEVSLGTFSEKYTPTRSERFAANIIELPGGIKKTLIMREIPDHEVKRLLSNKESLAACDIAIFVHDSSNESSWKKTKELLLQIASHGENTGFEVPCLIISAKDDMEPFPSAIQESTRVSQDMGIETPIPVSMKLRDFNNVFRRIISAAQHPHMSIPETEAGRSRKQYRRLVNRSLMFVSVGAAVAVVGLAAYRVYAARRNSSG